MAKKILVVDDEPDVRTLVSSLLKAEKFDVEEAGDGKQALALVKKNTYDLVLLDIMMPHMDGLHTAHEIKKISEVPIVIVSVKDDDVTMNMARKLYGAKGYVKKPFHNHDLLKAVKKALQ